MKSMKNFKILGSSILDTMLVETEIEIFFGQSYNILRNSDLNWKSWGRDFYQIDFIIVRAYTVKKGLSTNSTESHWKYKVCA